mmetsp:Transcript_21898/g.27085  ORF Transcript_21898/g.27085 Transcript_21898/m.27085 type:complete len:358 (-) Transcript_21898:106-1179(-)|eukprot:CAMPEP_0172496180 /NCGR_PEP_ID=MMETSP1066-20121228/82872_1 /TAXON_ID=671091 /ORGANISM="Coscinodiscus wailesii, Strain CCMP2513" /LENGTH=357 /DNA_ID=CAMNT_0013268339 /DNA_START=94 /DNA_END=1167 /DNA_ORIENTATION=+
MRVLTLASVFLLILTLNHLSHGDETVATADTTPSSDDSEAVSSSSPDEEPSSDNTEKVGHPVPESGVEDSGETTTAAKTDTESVEDTEAKEESTEEETIDEESPPVEEVDNGENESVSTEGDKDEEEKKENETMKEEEPVQSGPFVDLLGKTLLSLEMVDDKSARLVSHYTNDALKGKTVIGIYFSADWCGPCRQFTPELVSFYTKMNSRYGKKDQFQIVWVSRCRDFDSFGQFFTKMKWLALPFEDAAGRRGQGLSEKYGVKGIPTLVLLDEVGGVITTEARNMIPKDKAGIGFPWRNPLVQLYVTLFPKSFRLMIKSNAGLLKERLLGDIKEKVLLGVKGLMGKIQNLKKTKATT